MDQVGGFLVVEKVRKNDIIDPTRRHYRIRQHVWKRARHF